MRHHIFRTFFRLEPPYIVAFMRLDDVGLPGPALCPKEKINALSGWIHLRAIKRMNKNEILLFHFYTDLFPRLSNCRRERKFACLDMPRRNVVVAILVAGIESARKKHFPSAD